MIWPRECCQSDMLFSYSLNNFSMYNIENKQYTNTLQPSYREYFFDDLTAFHNLYGGFKLFVSNIEFADAKLYHNFVFTCLSCLFMAAGSFFITSSVFLQNKSS